MRALISNEGNGRVNFDGRLSVRSKSGLSPSGAARRRRRYHLQDGPASRFAAVIRPWPGYLVCTTAIDELPFATEQANG